MTLGTHITVAAAAASPFLVGPLATSPIAPIGAFVCAVASHFLADMIPHWDWPLTSIQKHPEHPLDANITSRGAVANDVAIAIMDMSIGVIGVAVAVAIGGGSLPLVILLAACFGAVLPDALQLLYFAFKTKSLLKLQQFHQYVHSKVILPESEMLRGMLLQSPVFLIPLGVLATIISFSS